MADNEEISLYIHFPFCVQKCKFCPIVTEKYRYDLLSAYIAELKQEIALCLQEVCKNLKVNCIHFGGGTPSLMKDSELDEILTVISRYVNIDSSEILLEMHPKFVDNDLLIYLAGLHNCTVNFGVQSFNDSVLASMNRHYRGIDALRVTESVRPLVRAVGIDYICDWPGYDTTILKTDLNFIKAIQPEHISQYPLSVKPNSEFEKYLNLQKISGKFMDKIELNQFSENFFKALGYHRYSTFHYENGKSITHLYGRSQLRGGKWIGFGSDAYTYLGDIVCFNSPFFKYIKGHFSLKACRLNHTEQFLWQLLFLMRSASILKEDIIRRYGVAVFRQLSIAIKRLKDENYIASEQDISLTWNGIINLKRVKAIIADSFI